MPTPRPAGSRGTTSSSSTTRSTRARHEGADQRQQEGEHVSERHRDGAEGQRRAETSAASASRAVSSSWKTTTVPVTQASRAPAWIARRIQRSIVAVCRSTSPSRRARSLRKSGARGGAQHAYGAIEDHREVGRAEDAGRHDAREVHPARHVGDRGRDASSAEREAQHAAHPARQARSGRERREAGRPQHPPEQGRRRDRLHEQQRALRRRGASRARRAAVEHGEARETEDGGHQRGLEQARQEAHERDDEQRDRERRPPARGARG